MPSVMPDVPAALSLLLANLVIIAGVLALSATMNRTGILTEAADRCSICAAAEAVDTVTDVPVCADCESEYFQGIQ